MLKIYWTRAKMPTSPDHHNNIQQPEWQVSLAQISEETSASSPSQKTRYTNPIPVRPSQALNPTTIHSCPNGVIKTESETENIKDSNYK